MDLETRIIDFWFGLPGSPERGARRDIWFERDDAFDAEIRTRFLADVEAAARGDLDSMARTPGGALALVILLDQFPRNLFRDSPRAFAADAKALGIAKDAVARGLDKELDVFERWFVYLPYEHSEDPADQERSVELFRDVADEEAMKYVAAHRDAIVRFGRFPHRNAILGRPSTPEEIAYLKEPGALFGAPSDDD